MKKYCAGVLVATLIGCGGGGGDSAPAASSASFPIEATVAAIAASSASYSANASDSQGASYNLAFSITPGPDKSNAFDNTVRKTYATTAILKKNNVTVATSTSETYYSISPVALWWSLSGTNDVFRATAQTALPATAAVGSSGAFYSGTKAIGNSSINTVLVTGTWSLEADTQTTAWLCLNTSTAAGVASSSSVESDCFKINTASVVSAFKADVTTNGTTLSFR